MSNGINSASCPHALPEAIKRYAVRGSGAIHSSLEDALADFNATAAKGLATLYTTDNPQVARYVAAGHTLEEAKALVAIHCWEEEYEYDSDNEYWRAPCQWLPPPKEAMIDAYMKFTAGQRGSLEKAAPPVAPELVENKYSVMVVDVFRDTYTVDVPMLSTDVYIFFCLVGQGFMPCSPWKLKLAIAACCPALGIQAWMKALSDLQGAAFKPYRAQQFTTCFDLYLGILEDVDKRVKKALQRDSKDWQLKNFCPVCTYKLEGEGQLYFSMLATCDGNNYLKRVLRKNKGFTEDGVPLRGGCKRPDPREASAGGTTLLAGRMLTDMVRSGELAKYPLAIENALMDAFGKDIGFGYDIGCGHAKTLKNSPLGPKAKEHNFRMLVGAFHGHAHNRRCQLKYLATYVEGMGIEDLEGCTFLVNNYEQAVSILDTEKTVKNAMAQAGVTEEMMKIRLEEEKAYLDGLSVEPEQETDQMEYYQQLVNLQDRRDHIAKALKTRSKAIWNALNRYNAAAEALDPPGAF
ncbi:hypothetical protein K438DRAFT_2006332 [Mycena galopus ATCC 62051]|nr:hypothetical protein K438DRAFT_2006332 [Mycena galopus ATCC 62051]